MYNYLKKVILPFIILSLFALTSALLPEILGDDIEELCKQYLGEYYRQYLVGLFLLLLALAMYFNPSIKRNLIPKQRELTDKSRSKSTDKDKFQTIQSHLKGYYDKRLSHKLSGRQPIKLKLFPSSVGSSLHASSAFVAYEDKNIKKDLFDFFSDSFGRLLLVGDAGTGKTTQLFKLSLEILAKTKNKLPVVLNLKSWDESFQTIEEWVLEVISDNIGFNMKNSVILELLTQNRFILLLDGLDEIESIKNRSSFLNKIGVYGQFENRQYIISSRISAYKNIEKDAPVNSQIEIAPLDITNLKTELEKIGYSQSGNKHLSYAIKKNEILGKVAQIPFYFNLLQFLFSRGKYLHDLKLESYTVKSMKYDIIDNFINESLISKDESKFSESEARSYLACIAYILQYEQHKKFELKNLQYKFFNCTNKEKRIGKLVEQFSDWLSLLSSIIIFGLTFITILSFIKGFKTAFMEGILFTFGTFIFIHAVLLIMPVMEFLLSGSKPKNNEMNLHIIYSQPITWTWKPIMYSLKRNFLTGCIFGFFCYPFIGSIKGDVISYLTAIFATGFAYSISWAPHNLDLDNDKFYNFSSPYEIFFVSIKQFNFSVLSHFYLRKLISNANLLPWNLATFLNEMHERNILEFDGASWRFRHSIFTDFFLKEAEILPLQYLNKKQYTFTNWRF